MSWLQLFLAILWYVFIGLFSLVASGLMLVVAYFVLREMATSTWGKVKGYWPFRLLVKQPVVPLPPFSNGWHASEHPLRREHDTDPV